MTYTTTIDGCVVRCYESGVLNVRTPKGVVVSVLPIGTHVALDVLGQSTKNKVVEWWQQRLKP